MNVFILFVEVGKMNLLVSVLCWIVIVIFVSMFEFFSFELEFECKIFYVVEELLELGKSGVLFK